MSSSIVRSRATIAMLSLVASTLLASQGAFAGSYQLHYHVGGLKKEVPQTDFTSQTFTTCGQIGTTGPTLNQCRTAYSGQDILADEYAFGVSAGIQQWTVPASGTYRIKAVGAQGGKPSGVPDRYRGAGASLAGTFVLKEGDVLKLVVGQAGLENGSGNTANGGGPGGGASFVWRQGASLPLLAAAGGGGAAIINTRYSDSNLYGVGGTPQRNGTPSRAIKRINYGTSGGDATYADGAKGWRSMRQSMNFTGVYSSHYLRHGGFGGGGLGVQPVHSAGGGGGYSGGGGGYYAGTNGNESGNPDGRNGGGGGGSYNSGSAQDNQAGVNRGDGSISISLISQH